MSIISFIETLNFSKEHVIFAINNSGSVTKIDKFKSDLNVSPSLFIYQLIHAEQFTLKFNFLICKMGLTVIPTSLYYKD